MARIGILAGGGRLPLMIAESVAARGGAVHIVAIEGEADPEVGRFAHTWVNWGQVGRMVATLRREGEELVIAGGVRRPDLWGLRPDAGFFRSLPQILGMLRGGDDSVLSRVVRFFEAQGLVVRGAHEVAPDLLAGLGPLGALALSDQGRADAELGFAVRAALGPLDAGQAVVAARGEVLAIEGAEGTDAMLERVARLRRPEGEGQRAGVLTKGPKPGQELRVDMPAIGPRTVAGAAAAGLAGIAVEAGAVLLLDRAEALREADRRAVAVEGLACATATGTPVHGRREGAVSDAGSATGAPVHGRREAAVGDAGGATGTPVHGRREGAVGDAGGATGTPVHGRREAAVGDAGGIARACVLGRQRPRSRERADVGKGLQAVARLAPYRTGGAVVVARGYILAVAASEGLRGMLDRVRALRQWGVEGRRQGVLVCRRDALDDDGTAPAELFAQVAAQGLAGIAVAGRDDGHSVIEDGGPLADRNGIFLLASGDGAREHAR